jgi:hypothetical protein
MADDPEPNPEADSAISRRRRSAFDEGNQGIQHMVARLLEYPR